MLTDSDIKGALALLKLYKKHKDTPDLVLYVNDKPLLVGYLKYWLQHQHTKIEQVSNVRGVYSDASKFVREYKKVME